MVKSTGATVAKYLLTAADMKLVRGLVMNTRTFKTKFFTSFSTSTRGANEL
jgi:hypothetical protein